MSRIRSILSRPHREHCNFLHSLATVDAQVNPVLGIDVNDNYSNQIVKWPYTDDSGGAIPIESLEAIGMGPTRPYGAHGSL